MRCESPAAVSAGRCAAAAFLNGGRRGRCGRDADRCGSAACDEFVDEAGAARILGLSTELLTKWRQHNQAPVYIQTERVGPSEAS
jgi:hypothetical protein